MSEVQKLTVARVVIVDPTVREKQFDKWTLREQTGYLKISDMVTHEIAVRVADDSQGYPAGNYLIAAESFRTDAYGKLQVNPKGIVLVPEKAGRA